MYMDIVSTSEARANLFKLISGVVQFRKPVAIRGKENSAVLVSEQDWSAIQETLYLMSIKGMAKIIRKGLGTPLDQCFDSLD